MAESTNPTLDNDQTRFHLRRTSWLQAQGRSTATARPVDLPGDVAGLGEIDTIRLSTSPHPRTPDWFGDSIDPLIGTLEAGLNPVDLDSPGAHDQYEFGVGHDLTPAPALDLSRFKDPSLMMRKLSAQSQGSVRTAASERSDPSSKKQITDIISSGLPSAQERAHLLALSKKSSDRQTIMTQQVVNTMSGMKDLTNLISKKMAPNEVSNMDDLSYYEVQARKLQLQHQEFDLEGKKQDQETARHERELRLK